jgi:hypothetical protein
VHPRLSDHGRTFPSVDGPLVEMVGGRPRPPLGSLVAGYVGYRITGAAPGTHRGLPSRNLRRSRDPVWLLRPGPPAPGVAGAGRLHAPQWLAEEFPSVHDSGLDGCSSSTA